MFVFNDDDDRMDEDQEDGKEVYIPFSGYSQN